MIAAQSTFELLILAVSGLGSGLFFLRNRKLPPLEKLCLAIGVSWLIVYLAGTAIFLAHLPAKLHFAVSGASLVLLLISWPELKRLWSNTHLRRTVYGFAILLVWNLLMLSLIRHYSGGKWTADWYEHYQRSEFFIQYLPRDTLFSDIYPLPARPPMMNLLCAHVLAQTGVSYDLYQLAAVYLNLLIYFPCVVLTVAVARRGRKALALLVVLFAFSPPLVENVTYTWTKLFCGFYVLLGTWLYLRGYQKQDSRRTVAAFASLSTALLVHYSAGPYLLFFTLHYAYVWFARTSARRGPFLPPSPVIRGGGNERISRKTKFAEPLMIAAVCALLLATWFGWSAWFYGWHTTLSSNTSVTGSQQFTLAQNIQKIASNLFNTAVPHPFRVSSAEFDVLFNQPNALGRMRDYWFLIFQTTLPTGLGTAAGLVVLYLLFVRLILRKGNVRAPDLAKPVSNSLRFFWLAFIAVCYLTGVAAVGQESPWGFANICLLPMALLGTTFLAANFSALPIWVRRTVAAFAIFDFSLGVFLHVRMEHLYFEPIYVGKEQLIPLTSNMLAERAVLNSLWRAMQGLPYWGDHFAGFSMILDVSIGIMGVAFLFALASATRGAGGSGRRPDAFFYSLLLLLVGGMLYCLSDELDGSAAAVRRLLAEPMDQLRQNVADAQSELAADPNSAQAMTDLGEALYRAGHLTGGFDNLSEAWALDPFNRRASYDCSILCEVYQTEMTSNQLVATRIVMADKVYLDPKSADARVQLGNLLLEERHPQAAVVQLRAAVQLSNSSSPDALLLLGIALQQLGGHGNIVQSVDCLSQALRLRPGSPQVISALRDSLTMRGDSPADIDAFIERASTGQ
jgi:tetratricopeptide (TPR) repeat protein